MLRRILHSTKKYYFSDTDEYVKRIFRHLAATHLIPECGFFVDVGCFHPTRSNTTYALYKRGWRGINIDVDQIKIEAFNLRRPQDTNIACAVSKQTGTAKYWRRGLWSDLNSLEQLERTEDEEGWLEIEVETDTLTNLIDQTPYKGRAIDFLSIDVEGHNLAVLQSLDFERYRPKVICVETWDSRIKEVLQSDLYVFLVAQGYILVNWPNLNLVLLHQDYPPMRVPGVSSQK